MKDYMISVMLLERIHELVIDFIEVGRFLKRSSELFEYGSC